MCGIYGMVMLNPEKVITKDFTFEMAFALNKNSVSRGQDSMGIAYRSADDNTIHHIKKVGHPYNILANPASYSKFEQFFQRTTALIGHTRYANRGAINQKNSHPFVNDDMALVHNGTITDESISGFTNVHEMRKPVPSSDSRAFFRAINHLAESNESTDIFKGFVKATSVLHDEDAFAFAFLAKKFLALTHNIGRPLYAGIIKSLDILVFASTEKIVKDSVTEVLGAKTIDKDFEQIKIGLNEMFVFETDGTQFSFNWEPPEVPIECYPVSSTSVSSYNSGNYQCNRGLSYTGNAASYPGLKNNNVANVSNSKVNQSPSKYGGKNIEDLYVKINTSGIDTDIPNYICGRDIEKLKKAYNENDANRMSSADRFIINKIIVDFYKARDRMLKTGVRTPTNQRIVH